MGGHDHSLQVIGGQDSAKYVIVSGAAAKTTWVEKLQGTLFAQAHLGFVAIDFRRAPKGDLVTLVVVESARKTPVFAMDLTTL